MPRSVIVRRSTIHGRGVFAGRDLPAQMRLIQYQGKLLTHLVADRHYGGNAESGHTFLFTLNDRYVIDGNVNGNSARWINHSCEPNCEAVLHQDAAGRARYDRIYIETRRAIASGEELTFDYGIVLTVKHTRRLRELWRCVCGTDTCSGTLLKDKRKSPGKKAPE